MLGLWMVKLAGNSHIIQKYRVNTCLRLAPVFIVHEDQVNANLAGKWYFNSDFHFSIMFVFVSVPDAHVCRDKLVAYIKLIDKCQHILQIVYIFKLFLAILPLMNLEKGFIFKMYNLKMQF